MAAQAIPALSRENLETGHIWEAGYHMVDPQPHLLRRWKLEHDDRDPLTILRLLPDLQQPQLPEGYLWLSERHELTILKHQDAPPVNFKIYLFGPDKEDRIQYLVAQNDLPTHGFAMTKHEGFPRVLRNDYGSVTSESFKAGETTYWRGHIIDYFDTLGDPSERDKISAVFHLNLKPEPAVCWSQTLRTKLLGEIREGNGSYSETMFYGFTPKKTNGARPIPEAVSLDRFTLGGRAGPELLNSYYVPREHECHTWSSEGKRDFTKNSLKKLESADFVSALIWNQGNLPTQPDYLPLNINLARLDVKQGYRLRQNAEVEYNSAQLKLSYVIYGVTHQAPQKTLCFWLKRTIDTALKIEEVYHSVVPPFQLALLGALSPNLPFVDQLQRLAERVLHACPGMVSRPIQQEEEIVEARAPAPLPVLPPPVLRAAPVGVAPTTICCSSVHTQNARVLGDFIFKVTREVERGSPLVLTQVYTVIAQKIFPRIGETAKRHFLPPYQPVLSIELKHSKWRNTIKKLAKEHFGYQGEIK